MDFRLKTFAAEVAKRFEFVVSEHGFSGPEVTSSERGLPTITVRYAREGTVIETSLVFHYAGEEYVATNLLRADADGARTQSKVGTSTAHKGHEMRRALDRHAEALRELLVRGSAA